MSYLCPHELKQIKNLISSIPKLEMDLTSKYEARILDLENTVIVIRQATERVSLEIQSLRMEIITNSIPVSQL